LEPVSIAKQKNFLEVLTNKNTKKNVSAAILEIHYIERTCIRTNETSRDDRAFQTDSPQSRKKVTKLPE
jgi:7,8-dihydro-6-hydroxymethylpterin-pyrophosphokinase